MLDKLDNKPSCTKMNLRARRINSIPGRINSISSRMNSIPGRIHSTFCSGRIHSTQVFLKKTSAVSAQMRVECIQRRRIPSIRKTRVSLYTLYTHNTIYYLTSAKSYVILYILCALNTQYYTRMIQHIMYIYIYIRGAGCTKRQVQNDGLGSKL